MSWTITRETWPVRARRFVFEGHGFVVRRGVFDPVRHLSGVAFAEHLGRLVAQNAPDARTALEIGTGCGLLAATLARLGLQVVATDTNESAVRCATENCAGLDVEVRHGDMFSPIEGQTFDIAVVNPPYERTSPTWWQNDALTSADFLERLGARVHEFAPIVVLGFPTDDVPTLHATGLDLILWRAVQTSGRDLGLFVSCDASRPDP